MKYLAFLVFFTGRISCYEDHDPLSESCTWRKIKCAPLCLTPLAPAQSCEAENFGCRDEGYARKVQEEFEAEKAKDGGEK